MLVVSVGCVFDILWTTGLLAFSWLCIRPLRWNRLSVETCYNSARWDQNVVKRALSMLANVTSGALQWLLRIPIYYFLTFATRLRNHLQREYDILYDVVADTNDSSMIHRKYNDDNYWKLNDLIPIILWTLDCLAPLESTSCHILIYSLNHLFLQPLEFLYPL